MKKKLLIVGGMGSVLKDLQDRMVLMGYNVVGSVRRKPRVRVQVSVYSYLRA